MDDEAYARELFRILTGPPDPDVPPGGLQPDWIDRHGGFGTEIQVTSVDVVPGPYGAQAEVGFVLEVPDGIDVPPRGSVLLPLDAEWRELSGYAEAEDYAPIVARQVEHGARDHVEAYSTGHARRYEPRSADETKAALLHVLAREGEVDQLAADRYVVQRGEGDVLTVVITPEQWEQVFRRHGPPRDGMCDHYDEMLASTPRDQRFMVFWEGDAHLSLREKLPPVATPPPHMRETKRRLAEAEASGEVFGWFAYTPVKDN